MASSSSSYSPIRISTRTRTLSRRIISEHAERPSYNYWKQSEVPLKQIKVPDHIVNIGERAFQGRTSLEEVILTKSIKEIRYSAFYNCVSLKQIKIPDHVNFIGIRAFQGCTSLEEVIFLPQSSLHRIHTILRREAFYKCASLKQISLPNSIVSIEKAAFQDCTSLEEVNFLPQSSLNRIGMRAFYNCTSLKKIILPNSIVSIGASAFKGCTSLDEVILPQSIREISLRSFMYCKSLKQVILPDSIHSIEGRAFEGCKSLVYVSLPTSLQSIGENAFKQCPSLSVIAAQKGGNVHITIAPSSFHSCRIFHRVQGNQMSPNDLLRQRFHQLPLHQLCYDPHVELASLIEGIQEVLRENTYNSVDSFSMNALHILCSNPSATCEMISELVNKCPSLRSMKSVGGLTPLMMFIKSKYGVLIKNNERVSLDVFLQHGIRWDEIRSILILDDEMKTELSLLDVKDETTGLYPFMKIASRFGSYSFESLYFFLRANPNLFLNIFFNHHSDLTPFGNEEDDESFCEVIEPIAKKQKISDDERGEQLQQNQRDTKDKTRSRVTSPQNKRRRTQDEPNYKDEDSDYDFDEDQRKPKGKRCKWTAREKDAVKDGFGKYGHDWTKIKQSYSAVLSKRTNVNIKDCYRTMQNRGEI